MTDVGWPVAGEVWVRNSGRVKGRLVEVVSVDGNYVIWRAVKTTQRRPNDRGWFDLGWFVTRYDLAGKA